MTMGANVVMDSGQQDYKKPVSPDVDLYQPGR